MVSLMQCKQSALFVSGVITKITLFQLEKGVHLNPPVYIPGKNQLHKLTTVILEFLRLLIIRNCENEALENLISMIFTTANFYGLFKLRIVHYNENETREKVQQKILILCYVQLAVTLCVMQQCVKTISTAGMSLYVIPFSVGIQV